MLPLLIALPLLLAKSTVSAADVCDRSDPRYVCIIPHTVAATKNKPMRVSLQYATFPNDQSFVWRGITYSCTNVKGCRYSVDGGTVYFRAVPKPAKVKATTSK